MRVETITRKGKEFAVIPVAALQKLMEDAEMLADVKAYDAAKARLEDGEDELIPLEMTERRLRGEPALRVWREHRKLTQERLAKKAKVSRALIAAIETRRKAGSVSTWKKLGAALDVSWEQLHRGLNASYVSAVRQGPFSKSARRGGRVARAI